MIQKTLVLIKPDAVKRGIAGEIISRFEKVGLKIIAMKFACPGTVIAKEHYDYDDIAIRHGKQVWERLIKFITSGPVIPIVLEGDFAIDVVRKIIGSTEPLKALPGTIRGDFAHHSYALTDKHNTSLHNIIHASASFEDADREIKVWFPMSNNLELCNYKRDDSGEHIFK